MSFFFLIRQLAWRGALNFFCLKIVDCFELVDDFSLQAFFRFFLAIGTFCFLSTLSLSPLTFLEESQTSFGYALRRFLRQSVHGVTVSKLLQPSLGQSIRFRFEIWMRDLNIILSELQGCLVTECQNANPNIYLHVDFLLVHKISYLLSYLFHNTRHNVSWEYRTIPYLFKVYLDYVELRRNL